MAKNGDFAMALMRVNLPLDRMNIGDGGEIEIFAPHERRQLLEKNLAGLDIAGDGPRLDEGGALPVLAHAFVIGIGRLQRNGDRRRAGVGAQPQIGAKHIAVGGVLAHDFDDPPREPREEIDVLVRPRHARALAVEQHDEIDVGGIIQLIGALLAHA